jgi:HAD superfamily hydrolase (TIGR01509 family)
MTPELLLLDLDGLIRHWRDTGARDGERLAGLPEGTLETAYSLPEYELAQLGVLTDQEWADAVCDHLVSQHGPAARTAIPAWRADRGEIDWQMLDLIQSARQHVTVAILSNTTSALPADLRLHGISGAFDAVFTSAGLGVTKPAPAAYRAVAAAMGTTPARIYFTDDELIHVRGARHAGLQAGQFTGPDQFSATLASLGVPLPAPVSAAAWHREPAVLPQ